MPRNRNPIYAQFVKARALAIMAHARQTYGGEPYCVHLQAVVDVLRRFGCSLDDPATAPCLIAAPLHDVLEDTKLTREDIEEGFGKQIADIVWAVSDENAHLSRRERKPATYAKTATSTIEAILVKLADRIANVENSVKFPGSGFFEMYRKEGLFREILEPVSRVNQIAASMWRHLEGLFETAGG